jgi:dephospho-CoA kinase
MELSLAYGMEFLGAFWVVVITLSAIVLFLFFKYLIADSLSTESNLSIGLTGNVAAGKSTVAQCWSSEGLSVVSADELAREAVKIGSPGLEEVVKEFGKEVLDTDGSLNRVALRSIIFNDKDARDNLGAILHPRIWVLRDRWIRERLNEGVLITASEVPLLFEAGLEDDFDVTVLVDAPEDIRMSRLTSGRDLNTEEAQKIIASQLNSEFKRNKADHVLINDGLLEDLMLSARELLNQIRKQSQGDRGPLSGRIRIDMHIHTRASFDCLSDPYRVLETAQERGVQRIAITDHNCLALALDMAKEFPNSVIPGEEVSTAEGIDVIGLYIQEEIPKGVSAKEVCCIIREQGGIVYLPHPYARGKSESGRYAEELAPLVDVVEVFNGRLHPGALNKPGEELAARWSKARGAGSDAHTVGEVAGAFIEIVDHPNDPASLLEALATARIRGATTPWSVHLASTWAKFRKQLPF